MLDKRTLEKIKECAVVVIGAYIITVAIFVLSYMTVHYLLKVLPA